MPQLDVFIFTNTGIYLFVGFFLILTYNHLYILPSMGSLLKLRKKIENNNKPTEQTQTAVTEIKPLAVENYL